MKRGRGRYLGAEPEAPGGFRAVDLDRLAIAAREGAPFLFRETETGVQLVARLL